MANTQGMSDEAMMSLLTPQCVAPAKKKSAFASRQEERICRRRQRMDQPMGERPAATVIRPSPPAHMDISHIRPVVSEECDPEEPKGEEVASQDEPAPRILGAIVERNVMSSHHASTTLLDASKKGTTQNSHFSQRQGNTSKGFPSVHMPIGTFVKNVSKKQTTAPRVPQQQQSPAVMKSPQTDLSIHQTSQVMMAQMTPNEIRDNVQELNAALSPEMIAFLQKRGHEKAKAASNVSEQLFPATTERENDTCKRQQAQGANGKNNDVEEKKRVASLLSSIKTHEKMDAVYLKEVGIPDDNGEEPVEDDWNTACQLLRSTSTRQTLWAARVVCQRLEADASAGKLCPVGRQDWPYPTILAVSLRCLLDNPVSQSSGLLLHTYVLRSLYALLQLRAHEDHVIDVTCQQRNTAAFVFQESFMDDAVPSPSFGTCYPTMTVQPVASTKDGDAVVAYSTCSSSTSAEQDGEVFVKDPMWTLLTRMRILPRLAQLLVAAAQTGIPLPDEAIVAICGILSMLSVRSIGTASAIAQHTTILASLLSITLSPQANGEYRGFFNTKVALPAIVFLCTLARQSRLGAAAVPVDTILPPILAMSAETDEEHTLQRWSLILWRTVLRYVDNHLLYHCRFPVYIF